MLQVLVGGFIALISKWVLEGGIRRRDRHVIREEIELAELLGDRPEADQLRALAEQRLKRYLRPPWTKRAAPVLRTIAIFVVAIGIGEAVALITTPDGGVWPRILAGVAVGTSVATFAQGVQEMVQRTGPRSRTDEVKRQNEALRQRIEEFKSRGA